MDEARSRILERARPLASEVVPVARASGRILAERARAVVDLPPFPSSAMDGFAVRSEDTPGTLPVVFRIAAGRPSPAALGRGEAMGIATGGVVPDGADAIVPIEYVVDYDNSVEIPKPVSPGANVRPRAGDLSAGDVVVEAGAPLRPAQLGALAASGIADVSVGGRPRATVLTTGTELRPPGGPLRPGQIYEANGVMLAAQLETAGAAVTQLSAIEDDEGAHRAALAHGLEADVLVTSGGVSVGPHDLVRRIEEELGVEEAFWGVAVKPGKPLSFGVRGRTLVFGLPGNPVSSLVSFELFVRPAVLALQGASEPGPVFELAVLAETVARDPNRDQLVRARSAIRDDVLRVEPVRGQESHMIARAAAADALVLIPRGEGQLAAGSAVRMLRLQ